MTRRTWVILALIAVALLAGVPGLWDRFANGHVNTGYGSATPWALWVVFYIYFVGLSAGAFLISSLVYVFGFKQYERVGRVALFTALVCLVVALAFIALDLGHMYRAFEVYTTPEFASPMAWMIWLYTAYFVVLAGEILLLSRRELAEWSGRGGVRGAVGKVLSFGSRDLSDESHERDLRRVKVLGSIGVPVAVAFHGGVGALFAVQVAHPYWNTGVYPIMFLVSALASGGALLTAITAFVLNTDGSYSETVIALGRLVLVFLFVDILIALAEVIVNLYGDSLGHVEPFWAQMFGPNWWVYWVVGLGMALIGPAIVLALRPRDARLVGAVCLVAVIGFVGVRWNIVLPAFAHEMLPGLREAYQEGALAFDYAPTLTEWSVTVGLIGVWLLLFFAGWRFFPLGIGDADPEPTASPEV